MELNERIRELRKSKGMTQNQFADMVGVTKQTVGAWETGEFGISTDRLQRICDTFNIGMDYLLGRQYVLDSDLTEEEVRVIVGYRKLSRSQRKLVWNMLGITD